MKKSRQELSAAEWEIMPVIWQFNKPVTVRQVLDTAYPKSEKAYTTVQTLMNILVEKGFLARRKEGRVNYYSASIPRGDVLRGSFSGMAQRMFQGSFSAMVSFLVGSGPFTTEELEDLQQILDKNSGERDE